MDPLLSRAEERLRAAHHILSDLQLMEQWRAFGDPVVVGAVALGLVVGPDIDMEIYCDTPRIEDGFEILRTCSRHPRIRGARFANESDGPDRGLYWQLRYQADAGEEWKLDMWSLPRNHPGPCAASLVEPMNRVLTTETRLAILAIKESLRRDTTPRCASIHIYRAVVADGVRTREQWQKWLERNPVDGLIAWNPGGI